MRTEPTSPSIFAFLSVLDVGEPGFIGGLLLLNRSGRPMEFHCTTPVRANRAQQILYGPTLRPYLFAEQIGTALLGKMKSKPDILFTDRVAIFELRDTLRKPVVLVRCETDESVDPSTFASTHPEPSHSAASSAAFSSVNSTPPISPTASAAAAAVNAATSMYGSKISQIPQTSSSASTLSTESELLDFSLGRNRFAVPAAHAEDRTFVSDLLRELAGWFDFMEPFGRITEAVNEARRAA